MQTVALIDYGSGNLHSARGALAKSADDRGLSVDVGVTSNPDDIRAADRIVLPGVGHFADCMRNLDAIDGVHEAIEEAVHKKGAPFLGICVGMQLLADRGLEDGITDGLGWIGGEVQDILPRPGLRIPHMGWNELRLSAKEHPVLNALQNHAHAYFVHSYHFCVDRPEHVIATTDYGTDLTAIVLKDNILGTQFHPEKSQSTGQTLLANWMEWRP